MSSTWYSKNKTGQARKYREVMRLDSSGNLGIGVTPPSYKIHEPDPSAPVVMTDGSDEKNEMLKVAKDGFYVRGVKVPVDDKEAETVYNAFKQWLSWNNLRQ